MINNSTQPPKVFISYSWDSESHKENVLKLANRLVSDGIDCNIDQYQVSPPERWPHWIRNQVEEANFVLVVCTEQYQRRFQSKEEIGKGKGVTWEGAIINQYMYDQISNNKFIPIVFSAGQSQYIPIELRGFTYYIVDTKNLDLDSNKSYEALYRHLTKQPETQKPKLGKLRPLMPRQTSQNSFEETQNNTENNKHNLDDIKQLIQNNDLKTASQKLLEFVNQFCPRFQNEVIGYKAKLRQTFIDENRGILSHEKIQRQKARIMYAMLELIKVLEEEISLDFD